MRAPKQEAEHPVGDLVRVLLLDDDDDAETFLTHCGFEMYTSGSTGETTQINPNFTPDLSQLNPNFIPRWMGRLPERPSGGGSPPGQS